MNKTKIQVSIVIVNYKVESELIACVTSILKSKPKASIEIVVVDNDEEDNLKNRLKNEYRQVKYIKSPKNLGYGGGNNLGAKYANGDFLFFLNPDTTVFPNAVDELLTFIQNKENVGIVGPRLLNNDGDIMPQGTRTLGTLQGIITLSFINKFFPRNNVSKDYFLADIDKSKPYEVDTVAGTALLIQKDIFFKIKTFDENFFLYFEEFDICKRVRNAGFRIFVIPQAKVMHAWGVSTKKAEFDVNKVFEKSRFYYFKKHFGITSALLVQAFTGLRKIHLLLIGILGISLFLNFYKLDKLMMFIGDQGWFYLSAKSLLVDMRLPLVGIPSSHPWLNQGPLWTYMLAIALWIFKFNPVSGAYLTSFLGTATVFIVYITTSFLFSKKLGIISAFLYATSPLIIMSNRFAYHTSIIPLFTILYIFFLYKWIYQAKSSYFSLAILMLAILYNLELATVFLWLILFTLITYGLFKKKPWTKIIFERVVLIRSALFFIIPMIPILIYDLDHGFVQTFGFLGWIVYKFISFLISAKDLFNSTDNLVYLLTFFYNNIQKLVFLKSGEISLLLFLSSIFSIAHSLYKLFIKKNLPNKYFIGYVILVMALGTSVISFFINKNVSDAYLPIFFPFIIIILALFLDKLSRKKFLYFGIFIILALGITNSYNIINDKYSYEKNQNKITFTDRINAAKNIVRSTKGKEYNIVGRGWLGEFKGYIMNYEYLTWFFGHAPSTRNENLKIYISESANGVIIENLTVNK